MQAGVLGREGAVVVGVGDEVDGVVRDGVVHPGAGADGLLGELVVRGARGEDADERQALLEEREVGDGGLHGDGGVVGGLEGVDRGEERAVGGVGLGAVEGLDDVGGGHGVAVGERGALADGDGEGGLVDLLRVAGGELGEGGVVVRVGAVEALEDVPVGAQAEGRGGLRRVVLGRSVGGAGGDGAAARGGLAALVAGGVGGRVAAVVARSERERGRRGGPTKERTTRHGAVHELLHSLFLFSSCGRTCDGDRP